VWGDQDKFFPVERAKEMIPEFATATFETIFGAGLFAHEERPAEVAGALLPTLTATR
jgi:pimeloyl-ACP methyl ester carboxylesterase